MAKRIGDYISNRNRERLKDIDFHDFMDMIDSGLNDEEIAKELGVHRQYVEKLKQEMKKDY
ncbi:helix-turn-helix domain-containing protein [Thermotalea metallivorans]|uniref:HTH luxR-type domain-containing protein n=1 Tax=Thermotalea metallivorans TaxID=520762 RepID=A0A140L8W6_9FIRM|nr:helix-turn-helix domain-containing protein [Thermotalea metallivorans]KXG76991.1 hypothetical protein AN619_05180 [Thermotalea metallivorans]